MITKLKLKGWRSHIDSEFSFSKGTNTLLGVMGAGKSSVLSGITFALFGTFPELQNKKLTLDDVIMKRPQQLDIAEVELSFANNGGVYDIKRTIERGKRSTHAEVRKNGELLDSGIMRTNDIVKDVLKMDYELFVRAIYSEQNGLDNFISLGKGERMKKIDQILNINKFESARQATGTVANRIRGMMKDKRALIDNFMSMGSHDKIEELEQEIEKTTKEKDSMLSELSSLDETRTNQEKSIDMMKNQLDEVSRLENEKSSALGSIESIESELEGQDNIDSDKLKNDINELKDLLTKEKENQNNLEQELRIKLNEKQSAITKRDELNVALERVNSVDGNCPVCEQKMDEEHKSKVSKERIEKISELNETEIKLEEEINQMERGIKNKKSEIAEIDKNIRTREREFDKISSLEEKRSRLDAYKRKLETVENRLREIDVDKEKFYSIQKELQNIIEKYSDLRARYNNLDLITQEKKSHLKELEESKEMVEKYKDNILKMERTVEDLGKLQEAMQKTQVMLRKEFVESVNFAMTEIWEHLYPYDDYLNVRLSIVEGDYALEFEDSAGNWTQVEGVASGGERTIALLCLRIAFANVLAPHLRWLVLDEPTHNLDTQAVQYLADVLREKIVDVVDQVILITHEEKLEDAVTGYLYRLEREKEKNRPTAVVELMTPMG